MNVDIFPDPLEVHIFNEQYPVHHTLSAWRSHALASYAALYKNIMRPDNHDAAHGIVINPPVPDESIYFLYGAIIVADVATFCQKHPEYINYIRQAVKSVTHRTVQSACAASMSTRHIVVYIPHGYMHNDLFALPDFCEKNSNFSVEHYILIVQNHAHVMIAEQVAQKNSADLNTFRLLSVYVAPHATVYWMYDRVVHETTGEYFSYTFLLQEYSNLAYVTAVCSGAYVNKNIDIILAGQGAQAECRGYYLLRRQQEYICNVYQTHTIGTTTSSTIINGIVDDNAQSSYKGLISIEEGAHKSCASQSNKTIVLSNNARATSLPLLEVKADNVRCNHASALGKILPEHIIYLQSRGLRYDESRKIIIEYFLKQVLYLGNNQFNYLVQSAYARNIACYSA